VRPAQGLLLPALLLALREEVDRKRFLRARTPLSDAAVRRAGRAEPAPSGLWKLLRCLLGLHALGMAAWVALQYWVRAGLGGPV
jgi:hypothetical protein